MAFSDGDGLCRDLWTQFRNQLGEESWNFAIFDTRGNVRVELQMQPQQSLRLVFYPDALSQFHVDFGSGKLTKRKMI